MTPEEIHNIYLHISGKAEGIAEVKGSSDFPVLFANAILDYAKTKEWIGLTDEEIKEVYVKRGVELTFNGFARAIEMRLKEKNSG